jgi:hypothetical protein
MDAMKTLFMLVMWAALTGSAFAQLSPQPQVLHVTAIRDWAPTDPAPASHAFKTIMVTGTIGSVRYVTEQLFSWGSQRFVVGTDYPVTIKGQTLNVTMQDKKGHNVPERLDVVSAEEVTK